MANEFIIQLRGSTCGAWDVHDRGETSHEYRIVGAQRVPPAVTRLTVYRWLTVIEL